ncbi:YraN family protein [Chryseobacterium sp.]|uniref:YraN family protein n=1 Tax=Chryseobacterium sp. TaxID=1871047 RepID=UPI0011CB1E25|nr:YraN family protein [Chryseobacterium sp.]TXF76011.1 YraN family protein [Chryseobacterium sp.]
MAEHNDFGHLAEDLAADFLIKRNYKILARNFRYQKAEIDIVAEFEDQIVVVEVKARSYNTVIEPQEAVTKKKIKSIVMCADFFMKERNINQEVRFDIITVLPDEKGILQINHIEEAFQSFDAN